jgi:CheY-like chemotaxis protein
VEPCDDPEPKHILIVDDEPLVRLMLARVLADRGFAVLEAEDGSDAVHLDEQHRQSIGAVLSDVRMPRVDGSVRILADASD